MTERSELAETLRSGVSKSLVSLLIKIATAGLTYLMFVVLSRSMRPDDYGNFAFGLSLATVLAIGASMGQQTAVLRFWPEELVAGRRDRALQALRAGTGLTLVAGMAISLGLAAFAGLAMLVSPGSAQGHILAAATLVLPLALAEYFSAALRAQGSVWTALVPRDIFWRLATPVLAYGFFVAGLRLDGGQALLLTAILLAVALVLQLLMARRRGYAAGPDFADIRSYWTERGAASRWFLAGVLLDSAALNIDIILVGLFVAPESAGIYFNAFRTAGLLTLFMFAITLVAAPMVARHYHAGEMGKAQAVSAFCAWAGFLFSAGVFVAYLIFGEAILSLFGAGYAEGKTVLILLSIGLLMDAATGPTRIVMMMTGHEKAYVLIFGAIMGLGMLAQIAAIPLYGVVAAAAINMGARILAQAAIAVWARRRIGLDTSLLGIFRVGRVADRPAPVPAM